MKLLILGLFLQGGYFHCLKNLTYGVDMEYIRWMGILEANDWAYWIPYGASSEAKIYMVKCGVRGDTGPACNAAGMIDCMILGVNHLYRKPIYVRTKQCSINSPDYGQLPPDAPSWCQAPFDPEGYLRSDPQAFMAMRLVNSRGRSSSLYLVTESMIIFSFQIVLRTSLILDRVFNQYVAIILSVTFVFLGEVIPQATCTRYGLVVGANFVWLMRILMLLSYPISYPIEKILDCVLGHNYLDELS
ncbi:hypothetical protein OROMI_018368 [Orobanche minor]